MSTVALLNNVSATNPFASASGVASSSDPLNSPSVVIIPSASSLQSFLNAPNGGQLIGLGAAVNPGDASALLGEVTVYLDQSLINNKIDSDQTQTAALEDYLSQLQSAYGAQIAAQNQIASDQNQINVNNALIASNNATVAANQSTIGSDQSQITALLSQPTSDSTTSSISTLQNAILLLQGQNESLNGQSSRLTDQDKGLKGDITIQEALAQSAQLKESADASGVLSEVVALDPELRSDVDAADSGAAELSKVVNVLSDDANALPLANLRSSQAQQLVLDVLAAIVAMRSLGSVAAQNADMSPQGLTPGSSA